MRAMTAGPVTERKAAGTVIQSDLSRFIDFYDTHYTTIARALGLTLGDPELGAEAADEAMTRAYQRWSAVSTYRNPEGWVYRVGRNWAVSFLRKRRRSQLTIHLEDTPVEAEPVRDPALAAALAKLDTNQRAVVVLRFYLDWSIDQTAAALDVKPGTVKSRLHRALKELERHLGVGGSGPTPATRTPGTDAT